jgi:two-component system, OmpR family, sensor histidine kinase BaeS
VELERLFRPRAEVAGLAWETTVPEGLTVHATHARLREMLDALLDNAFRYTPRGGTVRFTAREEGPRVLLEVTDTGPGIAPEEREQVFERFFRGKAAEASGQPGSGMGLSLVQALVAAEGGELAVAGPPGTRVTIALSAAPRDRPRLQSTS